MYFILGCGGGAKVSRFCEIGFCCGFGKSILIVGINREAFVVINRIALCFPLGSRVVGSSCFIAVRGLTVSCSYFVYGIL